MAFAAWPHHCVAKRAADAEYLLCERGVFVRRQTIRHRVGRLGVRFANYFSRDRPQTADERLLDEAVSPINDAARRSQNAGLAIDQTDAASAETSGAWTPMLPAAAPPKASARKLNRYAPKKRRSLEGVM